MRYRFFTRIDGEYRSHDYEKIDTLYDLYLKPSSIDRMSHRNFNTINRKISCQRSLEETKRIRYNIRIYNYYEENRNIQDSRNTIYIYSLSNWKRFTIRILRRTPRRIIRKMKILNTINRGIYE